MNGKMRRRADRNRRILEERKSEESLQPAQILLVEKHREMAGLAGSALQHLVE